MIFVESRLFTKHLPELLGDEGYRELQTLLVGNPDHGPVIPGCDGLRKIRLGLEAAGKGKRSGARVVYLHIPEVSRCDMLLIYSKDEKDDLTAKEKAILTEFAHQAKAEALAWARRKGKEE